MGFDTVDRGLLALNPWFPLNVRWLNDWVSENPSFLVWTFFGKWSWLPNQLADAGADVSLKSVLNSCVLLSARNVKLPPDTRGPGDPPGKPMLFWTMPRTGKSLCELYMRAGSCPGID
jgi:hypothetical protein